MKNNRLQCIYDFLEDGLILADVGSDHAYLPIHYVLKYPGTKSYAADIGVEPLNSARRNIELYKCQNHVFPILSDGLLSVPNDANGLVIAGMGVDTITEILLQSKHRWKDFKQMVLQPNLKAERLRKFLVEHLFDIIDEECVKDKKKYYIVFNVVYRGILQEYSEQQLNCGKYLKEKNSPVYWDYCRFRKSELEKILKASDVRKSEFVALYKSYEQELEWRENYGIE